MRYMRDRAERRGRRYERSRDYGYPMDYRGSRSESRYMDDARMVRDRHYPEMYYMGSERYEQPYRTYDYGMRGDYRRDYADDEYDKE